MINMGYESVDGSQTDLSKKTDWNILPNNVRIVTIFRLSFFFFVNVLFQMNETLCFVELHLFSLLFMHM